MNKEELLKMIEEDENWLLTLTSSSTSSSTADSRLIDSFEEINGFFRDHGREPESGRWIQEHKLYARLKAIREDASKSGDLKSLDKYNLLPEVDSKVKSLKDIFDDDDLGILMDESSIFDLKFVKKNEDRAETDFVARRKPCPDFDKYDEGFRKCHEEIKLWVRTLSIFQSEESIRVWMYFVLDGVLVYIKSIGNIKVDDHHKKDGRLHCIFENGTESNMLLRSLWKAMRQNRGGRVVSEPIDKSIQRLHTITEDDTKTGYIYVLKSLSKDPKIQSIDNLYKIGFSSTPIEERIKNAEQEPTYLMSRVHLCMSVECYNMNPQKFEKIIHTFFGKSCINLDIFDKEGRRHSPREWFSVPIETIEQAIDLIVSDQILGHRYDNDWSISTII
jgi:hypothetical protein